MKTAKLSFPLAVDLILFGRSAFGSENTNDFVITSFSVTGNQGALMWSGGRPTYQVQTRSAFSANWINVGSPLGEGKIVFGCITCPWHGYQYQPDTGASPPPFVEKVPTFNVRVKNGRVLVDPKPNPAGTRAEPARITE